MNGSDFGYPDRRRDRSRYDWFWLDRDARRRHDGDGLWRRHRKGGAGKPRRGGSLAGCRDDGRLGRERPHRRLPDCDDDGGGPNLSRKTENGTDVGQSWAGGQEGGDCHYAYDRQRAKRSVRGCLCTTDHGNGLRGTPGRRGRFRRRSLRRAKVELGVVAGLRHVLSSPHVLSHLEILEPTGRGSYHRPEHVARKLVAP
jgi:hypothetical protein